MRDLGIFLRGIIDLLIHFNENWKAVPAKKVFYCFGPDLSCLADD